MKGWSLQLRHDGVLLSDGEADTLLETKAAALFAFLAVEGPTSRRALSALLWPDSEDGRGRANLRQLLTRLGPWRNALVGPDPLGLHPDVATDARELLPERLDMDESTAFSAWLDEARERRRLDRLAWLRAELARHEAAGRRREAWATAEEVLALEPSPAAAREVLALAGRSGLVQEGLALYRSHERRLARDFDSAPDEATRLLAQDLANSGDLDALDLLAREGTRLHGASAATALERIDAARPSWIAGWERAVAARDAAALTRVADALSDYFELRGDVHLAVTLLAKAQLALDPSDVPSERRAAGRLLTHLAWHEQRLGLPTSGPHADRALTLLSRDEDPAHVAQALYASGRALWAAGDVAAARRRWDRAHAHLEGAGEGLRAAYLHANVAMAADVLGETDRAKRHYRSALERFRRNAAEGAATSCMNNLGQLLVEEGAVEEGSRLLDQAIALARAHDQRATLAYLLDSRCRAELLAGRPDRARSYLDEATSLARTCSDRVLSASIVASEARIALAEQKDALPRALAALAAARRLGLRPAVLETLVLVADALRAAGAEREADRILATVATEDGPSGATARDRLDGRSAAPAGELDGLVAALIDA